MNYALLLLLGPGQVEINRLCDLLNSIISQEEKLSLQAHLVIVNDGSNLLDQLNPYDAQFKSINCVDNPLYGKCNVLFDRHVAGMIQGVKFIYNQLNVEFVVKMDTDVMCINPFAQRLGEYFSRSPRVGIAGTFLNWPMGDSRQPAFDDWYSRVKNVHHKLWLKNLLIALKKGKPSSFLLHFKRRQIFKSALAQGYHYGVHIMGGAYAISQDVIKEWNRLGYLKNDELFERSYLGEDSVMTILTYAAGFKLGCFNNPGDVFGVWYKEPEQEALTLQKNGYSLIHSIKCADADRELSLRKSFRDIIVQPKLF